MITAVVLVKQVPDLRRRGVGLRADGTIDRSTASPITNPADLHAVDAAVQLADEVCPLTMDPARADETLRHALAAGANRAVLLCDPVLAGSDTWATANALATAIEWIGVADLILCGISGGLLAATATGRDLAPRVASMLDTGLAADCTDAGCDAAR